MNALRPAARVMQLGRLGSAHQTRLSFMRVLLRGLRRGGWQTDRPTWNIDENGVGHAVYRIAGQGQVYSLVAFAHDLPAEQRSDRVIAEAWDATFALIDGTPDKDDIARLSANVPLQEAGRISDKELVLSRANRSVRLWSHVVERLASGRQPDPDLVREVGYLMRTTAVYGSGKFGAADFQALAGRPVLDGPFRAEMLAVWLIRTFVMDLVEHMARAKGGASAAPLAPDLRRSFGIGNSTGLGMAPYLVNHPGLLNAWVSARETALARVRAAQATAVTRADFRDVLARTVTLVDSWQTRHPHQLVKLDTLKADMARLTEHVARSDLDGSPWDALWRWGEAHLSVEGQELLASLLIEPHGALVDDLADAMGCDEAAGFRIDGTTSVAVLREMIARDFGWALDIDHAPRKANARFWYVSEAKLEPRLGERHDEPGAELEQPLDTSRAIARLAHGLASADDAQSVAEFLRQNPEHRHTVRRVQMAANAPYADIRSNLICAEMMPIDMLRCKLAFFGATRFDPRSDRWVRITMFQGAPFPGELSTMAEDDWVLPPAKGQVA